MSAVIGRYWPGASPVHRMDPRAKLTLLVVVMAAVFAARGFAALCVAAVFVLAFLLAARIPLGAALRSILPLVFIVVLTALFNLLFVNEGQVYFQAGPLVVSSGGVEAAVFLCIRLLLLLLVASLLTLTTTTLDLTDGFEAILAPFARLGVPAHEFSLVMGIALRFLPQFADELRIIRAAQLSRGANLGEGLVRSRGSGLTSVMVPLFTSAFRHAETLAGAMDARCYHGGVGRTKLEPLRFTWLDAAGAVACAAMLACVLAASLLA